MAWQPDEETTQLIRAYCLHNALRYQGKGKTGSVMGRLLGEREDLRRHGGEIASIILQGVLAANSMANEQGLEVVEQELEVLAPRLLEKKVYERKTGLPPLPNSQGRDVVLRFAPNPNGPLSFGHSRGLIINSEYAKQHDGTLILRFDDTDTVHKPPLPKAYSMIEEEVAWLTELEPKVVIASERVAIYHQHARRLIEMGGAYICQCSSDEFKQCRLAKSDCPHRDNQVEDNLELWQQMMDGGIEAGGAVVRVKTDMTLPNPALRDWPALRIQDTQKNPHPRANIGSRWRVWPLLDFQSAVEDHLQGVTHIIRGKDLMDSTRKQLLLYEHFGWQYPETIYWGRVKVHEFGEFSTSQMRADIEAGIYSDWDDVRLPTIRAMQRRGIQAAALRSFWLELGLTQKDISAALSTLNAHNTSIIDRTAPRLSFVRDPVSVTLDTASFETPRQLLVPSHPEHDEFSPRLLDISDLQFQLESEDVDEALSRDGSLRLKDFADIRLIDRNRATLTSLEPNGMKIIHWVSQAKKQTLYSGDGSEMVEQHGLLETHQHAAGTLVQLERVGYAVLETDGLVLCHN